MISQNLLDQLVTSLQSLQDTATECMEDLQSRYPQVKGKEDIYFPTLTTTLNLTNLCLDLFKECESFFRKRDPVEVLTLLKWIVFIATFSLSEYTQKKVMREHPEHWASENVVSLEYQRKGYKISLMRDIIRPAVGSIITESEAEEWWDLAKVRNYLTHNNGVAMETETLNIGDTQLQIEADQMMKGGLTVFLGLSQLLVKLHTQWLRGFIETLPNSEQTKRIREMRFGGWG